MKNKSGLHVLILGVNGMLGRTVYVYLKNIHNTSVWGSIKTICANNPQYLRCNAFNIEKDLANIYKKIRHIDYIINCIGKLQNYNSLKNLIYVNALFPHLLSDLAEKYNVKLIHVSSDAVFSKNAGEIKECDETSPDGLYGASKLLGEIHYSNSLTIRTSILGLDPSRNHGLLEGIINKNNKVILGYTNQKWSGCTTLQFAKLCEDIIFNNYFSKLRKLSSVIHFAPLGPITKYKLINEFIKISKIKKSLKQQKGIPINRLLKSLYLDSLLDKKYSNNIKKALEELMSFEKIATKYS